MSGAGSLAFEDRGDGPAIVLLHGHPFDRTMWAPQLEALSARFRVLAPDLPGYGESPLRADPMTMRAFAEAVIELLDALGIERATMVGLSMGGLIAMELGLGFAERAAGLVLAATTAAPATPRDTEARRAKAALAEERGMLPIAAEMIAQLFGPSAARDVGLVERIFHTMLLSSPAGAAAALRGRALRPDYSALLASLEVPALIITCEHDAFAPEPVRAQLVNAVPGAEVWHFAESGHMPNLEEPERFNEAVSGFAGRL